MTELIPLGALAVCGVGVIANSAAEEITKAAVSGIIGGVADRGVQTAFRRLADRLREDSSNPENETILRTVRLAQLEALTELICEYDEARRWPRWWKSRTVRSLLKALPRYLQRERERASDPRLTGRLVASSGGRSSATTAIDAALKLGERGLLSTAAKQSTDSAADASDSSRNGAEAETLTRLLEDLVLEELKGVVKPATLPKSFVSWFSGNEAGRDGFSSRFARQLQHAIETNSRFFQAYMSLVLSEVQVETRANREIGERIESVLEKLQEDQLRGMNRAREALAPEDSLHFVSTESYFRNSLSSGSVFHHDRPLVGRRTELAQILGRIEDGLASGKATVLALSAVGGSGKSRLLLEAARHISGAAVLWVRDGEVVSFSSLGELPRGPLVVFCDDAHRRSDLSDLIRVVDARNEATSLVLCARPYGRSAIPAAVHIAKLPVERLVDLGILLEVPKEELERLVADELGPDFADSAHRLLELADGSILVALVAARLLRTQRRDPRTVSLDTTFRQVVLDGFRAEAIAAFPDIVDQSAAKRCLEALAAVQPVALRDGGLTTAFARYVGLEESALQRMLDTLVEGGVLREDRSGLRIQPDVLGDHILHHAMVARGASTKLDLELLDQLGSSVLLNLVRNVAELDWQRENGGDAVRMFDGIWTSFLQSFRDARLEEQREWLEKLSPVAVFQPRAILDLAHLLLVAPPVALEERDSWGLKRTYSQVLEALPPLISLAAHYWPTVSQALDLLWALGKRDERMINPHPAHGIRQLQELVGYSLQRDSWMQDEALHAMERWLGEAGWAMHLHSPLIVAEAVLATEMIDHAPTPDRRGVVLTRYEVPAAFTMDLRLRAISLIAKVARSSDKRERHQALAVLLGALHCQNGTLGHEVTKDEEAAFGTQFSSILDVLEEMVRSCDDPVAMVLIRTRLHRLARHTLLDWIAKRMRTIAASVADDESTRLARALGYFNSDWDVQGRSVNEGMAVDEDNRTLVAKEIIAARSDAPSLVEQLGDVSEAWIAARESCDASPLLYSITSMDVGVGAELADYLLEHAANLASSRVEWLIGLLAAIRLRDTVGYESLLKRASTHGDRRVRMAAALSMARPRDDNSRSKEELSAVQRLLQDQELTVARAAILALTYVDAEQVASLLGDVQLHGDQVAASHLANVWGVRRANDALPRMTEAAAQHLLVQLVPVPSFHDAETSVSEMLAVLAEMYPHRVLDFLDARVREEHRRRAERQDNGQIFDLSRDSYDAIPYRGFDGLQDAFERSPEYLGVIRRVLGSLGVVVDGILVHDAAAHDVLGSFSRWDSVLEDVIRGWMMEKDHDMLVRSSSLFAKLDASFVLEQHPLVADLLEFLGDCEPVIDSSVTVALTDGAFSGPPIVRSIGTPSPMLTRIEQGAGALAEFYAGVGRPRVCSFYMNLAGLARGRLESERKRDIQAAEELR